jgi:hypothetical protein
VRYLASVQSPIESRIKGSSEQEVIGDYRGGMESLNGARRSAQGAVGLPRLRSCRILRLETRSSAVPRQASRCA